MLGRYERSLERRWGLVGDRRVQRRAIRIGRWRGASTVLRRVAILKLLGLGCRGRGSLLSGLRPVSLASVGSRANVFSRLGRRRDNAVRGFLACGLEERGGSARG